MNDNVVKMHSCVLISFYPNPKPLVGSLHDNPIIWHSLASSISSLGTLTGQPITPVRGPSLGTKASPLQS